MPPVVYAVTFCILLPPTKVDSNKVSKVNKVLKRLNFFYRFYKPPNENALISIFMKSENNRTTKN